MNSGKICISVCAADIEHLGTDASTASKIADLVEIRLDCLDQATENLSGLEIDSKVIITLRPSEQGGNKAIDLNERRRFWSDFQLRCGADLEPDVIETSSDSIKPKICSIHDFSAGPVDLDEIYLLLSKTSADVLKIAVAVKDADDAIGIWQQLSKARSDGRKIIPIAMGEAGKWTRVLGLANGAFLTYAALESANETAPGQITARDMIDVYRVKELDEETQVYGIIAGDTTYTMSPYIHNAAFKAQNLNAVFVPFQVADLDAFIRRIVRSGSREIELNFRGFSVTNPHKQAIFKHLDHFDEAAERIGAVNTIKIVDGKLHGFNTDSEGFIYPLNQKFGELKDARVAAVGAGGAARACIYALKNAGADVTVFARKLEKARTLAHDFNVSFKILETGKARLSTAFSDFDIVVNTTPLGTRGEYIDETIATADELSNVKLVYDLVYNPSETRLLHEAKKAGAETLGGFDMLMAQAARQFEIWTGIKAPVDVMSAAAKKRLYDS